MNRNVIISDLDGTIALSQPRADKYLHSGAMKDWKGYYDNVLDDEPNPPVITLLQTMADAGADVIIMTGRVERTRDQTLQWLSIYNVPHGPVLMRPDDDRTDDHIMKLEWFDYLKLQDRVLFVLEDRDRMVEAFRRRGIPCFQVASGNF